MGWDEWDWIDSYGIGWEMMDGMGRYILMCVVRRDGMGLLGLTYAVSGVKGQCRGCDDRAQKYTLLKQFQS